MHRYILAQRETRGDILRYTCVLLSSEQDDSKLVAEANNSSKLGGVAFKDNILAVETVGGQVFPLTRTIVRSDDVKDMPPPPGALNRFSQNYK